MSVSRHLTSFGKFYVNRTILGIGGAIAVESLAMKALGHAKYMPFYMFYLVGSTVLLIMGITGFIFTGAMIAFQGVSSFSDTGLLASTILTVIGGGAKLALFLYIRRQEKKARVLHESLKAVGSIAETFITSFVRELQREQGQIMNNVIEKHPEILTAFNSFQTAPQPDNHHLH